MPWRTLALMAPLLMAAGQPPDPCGQSQGQSAAQRHTGPVDLSGRPLPPPTPFASSAIATSPVVGPMGVCGENQKPSGTLRDTRSDALHALPTAEPMPVIPVRPIE